MTSTVNHKRRVSSFCRAKSILAISYDVRRHTKELGPGCWFTVIRKDLLERTNEGVAPIMTYKAQADAESCLNTPQRLAFTCCLRSSVGWIVKVA